VTAAREHERDPLEVENDALRREIEALRASTSYRLGHAVVRATRTIVRRRADPPRDRAATVRGAIPTRGVSASAPMAAAPTAEPAHGIPLVPSNPDDHYPQPRPTAVVRTRPTVTHDPPAVALDDVPPGPVLVGGTGRSGTWVLGRMLAAHPGWVTIPTELRFHAVSSGFRAVLRGDRTPDDFADSVRNRWYRISGGGGHAKGLQLIVTHRELREAIRRFQRHAEDDLPDALGCLLLDVTEPFVRGRGALGWTETTPANAESAAALLTALPRGRLIHTVRDGRDVAASVATMPWGPNGIEDGLRWWAQRVLDAHHGTRPVAGRVLTVRLEELVHLDRDARFDELVAFTGFTDPTALRRYFDERVDARRGNVGRWRGQVDVVERSRIDGRYREILAELGDLGVTCLPTDPDVIDELSV
jgi:hypothetical protein